jgi:hypothetical protein
MHQREFVVPKSAWDGVLKRLAEQGAKAVRDTREGKPAAFRL